MPITPVTCRRTSSDIDQTDAVANATSESGTPLAVLLRRRSTLSPNDRDETASPKSLDFDNQDDDKTEASGSGDDASTTSADDLEAGDVAAKTRSIKKKCGNNKRFLLLAVWAFIVIGLVAGLIVVFRGKHNNNSSAVFSTHENYTPPQQKDDPEFSLNINGNGNTDMPEEFSDEDDDQAFITSSPKKIVAQKPEILEWPELVGMWGENAKARLEEQYGNDTYNIIIVPENSPVTRDFRLDRIRLFVDEEGKIVTIPRVG